MNNYKDIKWFNNRMEASQTDLFERNELRPSSETFKIIRIYMLLGGFWILFSDKILDVMINDHNLYIRIQTYKGWFYIVITGIIFYYIIKSKIMQFKDATDKIHQGYEELSAAHEELLAMDEELNLHYNETIRLKEFLHKEKELSDSIINNASIIILGLNVEGAIIEFNPFAENIIGYSKDEVLGEKWLDLFIPVNRRRETNEILNRILSGEIINSEDQVKTKKGNILDILWNSNCFKDSKGNIQGIVATGINMTERKVMEDKLFELAYFDTLSQLPNRQMFELELEQRIINALSEENKFALLYLDLDNFKNINDTFGHSYGDKLIKEIAIALRSIIDAESSVSRLGGDEFGIIIPKGVDNIVFESKVTSLMEELNKLWIIEGNEFYITCSLGISIYPDDGVDAQTLLKNSDTAMYVSKNNSKNCYTFYSPNMQNKSEKYLTMEKDLRSAILNNEFQLYYQPLINLKNKDVVGVEALVRWVHPVKGMIMPADFIGFAEETGLINSMGDIVITQACQQLKRWQDMGFSQIYIAVNLSAKQLRQHDLIDKIVDNAQKADINVENLLFEITENIALYDFKQSVSILNTFKNMNVRVALDDFGTGYSSLNYLKLLPINMIKIDKSFVKDITIGQNEKHIARAIIELAHNMDVIVTAEGIETEEQYETLFNFGCDLGQGYLFSKPVPAEEVEKLLRSNCRD